MIPTRTLGSFADGKFFSSTPKVAQRTNDSATEGATDRRKEGRTEPTDGSTDMASYRDAQAQMR